MTDHSQHIHPATPTHAPDQPKSNANGHGLHGHSSHGHGAHGNGAHGSDDDPWRMPSAELIARLERESRVGAPLREVILLQVEAALDPAPRAIVELGSGIGADAIALAERFPTAQVYAVDVSEPLLARVGSAARSAGVGERVVTRAADVNQDWAAVIPSNLDLVWAQASLHHLADPSAALQRAFASLRPGGALALIETTGPVRVDLGRYGDVDRAPGGDLAERIAQELSTPAEFTGIQWPALLQATGFAPVKPSAHEIVIDSRTPDGAAQLAAQFRGLRDRVGADLPAAQQHRLDVVIDALESQLAGPQPAEFNGIVVSSTRSVWLAVRPLDDPEAAREHAEVIDADVAVLGGGPAGLAAAVALARTRRSVVVIDAGEPRNATAAGAHNVLGQEGVPPFELRERGRREAESYGVQVLAGRASAAGEIDDFTVETGQAGPRVRARRVILATGLEDELPEIPGVREGWGRSVLHCPFCHGWEVRDQRIAIIARDDAPIHQAMLFRELSEDVTVFLHDAPDPSAEQWEQLAALGVSVVRPRVERLVMNGTELRGVEIVGGRVFESDAAVVVPRFNARTGIYEALGGSVEATPFGRQIPTDPRGGTGIPGVWAAGNASNHMAMVLASAASGVITGAAVHGDLALADLEQAVRARSGVVG